MTLMVDIKTAKVGDQIASLHELGGTFATMQKSQDKYELKPLFDKIVMDKESGVYDMMEIIDIALISTKHGSTFVNNKEVYVVGRVSDNVLLAGYQYDGRYIGLSFIYERDEDPSLILSEVQDNLRYSQSAPENERKYLLKDTSICFYDEVQFSTDEVFVLAKVTDDLAIFYKYVNGIENLFLAPVAYIQPV
jgi:hypothetical protein